MVILASSAHSSAQRFKSIETLLVDCKIVSFQLRSSEPYLWAVKELSGYGRNHPLPFYRLFPCRSVGLFRQHKTGQFHVEEISPDPLDEKDKGSLCFYHARMPIMDYLDNELGPQESLWPRSLVNYYQDELLSGFSCEHAWLEFSDDVALRLMSGVRHVLAAYLLHASALLNKNAACAHKGAWSSVYGSAHPSTFRRAELGW